MTVSNNLAVGLFFIGLVSAPVLCFLPKLAQFVWLYSKPSQLRRYLHADKEGKPAWALVTGATDGMGEQFAHELSRQGFNVVLHGRNPAKLARVQSELTSAFPERAFRTLVADCTAISCHSCSTKDTHNVDFDAIVSALADINLTVLINNAGGGISPVYQYLHDSSTEKILETTNLNALFPLLLQAKLLPQLIQNSPALVINMGSIVDVGLPVVATYAASKRFLNCMAESLTREMAMVGRDVEVLAIRAGGTSGTSSNREKATFFEPEARTMARAALARAGCGQPVVIGYWPHAIQAAVLQALPSFVLEPAVRNLSRARMEQELAMQ
ncbi:short chain dehydrogenase/reductase [Roridomyces roridus]|uniref:Short chain dehydrogenase/reductase n=1 Tax=Roridomyces roridus TaxID=1738132 RepID=A0AAD7FRV9_9AGAR|nr:short chain dehydrogenase/reductase [Roridomyces roridus]